MLFTLLTFPLCCTLDIEQCGRGRLLTGPFANEAIKSILPWLSKGPREQGKSSAVSANTKCLSNAAVRIHNRPCFVVVVSQSVWFSPVSATLNTAGDHRRHQAIFIHVHWISANGNGRKTQKWNVACALFVSFCEAMVGSNCCALFWDKTIVHRALLRDQVVDYCFNPYIRVHFKLKLRDIYLLTLKSANTARLRNIIYSQQRNKTFNLIYLFVNSGCISVIHVHPKLPNPDGLIRHWIQQSPTNKHIVFGNIF